MSQFIQFKVNLDTFINDLQKIIKANNERVDMLLKLKEKNFTNFVKPMQLLDEELELFFTPLSHVNSVNNSEKTQKVYAESLPIITKYSTELSQNIEIYNIYKEIQQRECNQLNYAQNRVLELNIQGFELSGAHLSFEVKKQLADINLKKSDLSNNFSQNLLDSTNAYEKIITNKDDVDGIPSSDLEDAKFEEDGMVKYKFTLKMPS
jgi:oligopeptidase A